MPMLFAASFWSFRLALATSAPVVLLGIVVLNGWALGSGALIQVLPSWPPMPRNVAASFMLASQKEGAGATFSFRVPAAARLMPTEAH